MKRLALLLVAVALLLPAAASAQLTMQMSNGWAFTFTGNVNAFWVFTRTDSAFGSPSVTNSSVRTGLLPAFAQFEASGKEAGLNLGIHFGFAPQINAGGGVGGVHDNFGIGTQAGAQIDMREVWLTVGGDWGQILAGRALGLFQRQNIVQDMTLFGVGSVGSGGGQGSGTTLGRIGYGYIYPNFNAQLTYSSPAKNQFQIAVGAFQPSIHGGGFAVTEIPRVEAEVTYRPKMTGRTKLLVWAGGEWQTTKNLADTSSSTVGGTGGVKVSFSDLSIVANYYYGKGIGFILGFLPGSLAADGEGRKSDGGYGQVTYTADKVTFGASWGYNRIKGAGSSSSDGNDNVIAQLSSYTGGIYYQWTKSLKLVGEVTREINHHAGVADQTDVSGGFMLFF